MFRYSLIITQYYHSRHMFLVKIDENFIEKAREFAWELMQYKRSGEIEEKYLGDLDEQYRVKEIRARYNINDAGDIYFINAGYINKLMYDFYEYKNTSRIESAGFKKKVVLDAIREHHDYDKIFKMVEKYFEIV